MTESVARLRGEQLTLGYGKYTVCGKSDCQKYLMVTSRQLSGQMAAVNPRYCVP